MVFTIFSSICAIAFVAIFSWMIFTILRVVFQFFFPRKLVAVKRSFQVGDVTLEELSKYSGQDPYLPILLAVRGRIYDVSAKANFYGPGGGYSVFAGREVARALGKMQITADHCSADTSDFTEKEEKTLQEWVDKFDQKYEVVGKVVPDLSLTLEQLAAYDGETNPAPIYLAIKGVIFDVTRGSQFYGPDGAYPFGGRECARALAKFSTEIDDCNDELADCTLSELDTLRDWQAQFYSKYPIVGRVVKASATAAAAE